LTESAAAAAAQDVLPNVRFVVENLLEATKAYLLGTIEATPAARVLDEGWTYGENQLVYLWDYGFSERQFAVAVCFASCGVLGIALNDERVQALSNETWDPYLADTAMFCANAASRGRPGELEMDLKLRQEFWEWYLSTAVPAASMVDRKSLFGVDFTLPNTVT
jgi:hypothetical protein